MTNYGIYLISDPDYSDEQLRLAVMSGVRYVQLRLKDVSSRQFYEKAVELKKLCREVGVKLIINDRLDIALAVSSDGLHVGQSDLDVKVCKRLFSGIIGVSATTLEEAKRAKADGADYIGVGAMFPTTTKKDAKYVSLAELKEIEKLNIDIVCIGGIKVDNIASLSKRCAGVAICRELMASENPKQTVEQLERLWQSNVK